MPISLAELKQKRAKIATEMRSQHDSIGDAAWTDEQRSRWEAMKADLKHLDEQIKREEEVRDAEQRYVEGNADDLARRARESGTPPPQGQGSAEEQRAAAFDRFVRVGLAELTPEERQILRTMKDEARAQGTGTGSAGGYTVPRTFLARVIESMVSYGGIASVSQILNTDSGETIEWPVALNGSEEGELLGENDETSEEDVEFAVGSLGAHKTSSKIIRVSNELLADAGIDVEGFLAGRIGSRLGRIEARLLVQGTGAGTPLQPKGLEASVTITKNTAAAASFTWKEINALIHSVDPAYRNSPKYRLAFNDNTLKTIEEMEDGQGRPLWLPGIDGGAPPTILKRPYVIDPAIADIGAGKMFMFGGDFNQFVVRRVKYMALKRLVERYVEFDQTAFLAFARFGCCLQDTGAIGALVGKPA